MTQGNKTGGTLSFGTTVFGEKTAVPIDICSAEIQHLNDEATARMLQRELIRVGFTVRNSATPGNVTGKLQVPLPVGCTIQKFEFQNYYRSNPEDKKKLVWFPAVPVPKKKAKEIVYKEKEKGL